MRNQESAEKEKEREDMGKGKEVGAEGKERMGEEQRGKMNTQEVWRGKMNRRTKEVEGNMNKHFPISFNLQPSPLHLPPLSLHL